jgi:hypothetical protein
MRAATIIHPWRSNNMSCKPMNEGQLHLNYTASFWKWNLHCQQVYQQQHNSSVVVQQTVTMHHLMSCSHSPGHRILTTDVNCHLFITMKDSGFLLWKTEPGRNHVKCVAENFEVTFLVFQRQRERERERERESVCVCVGVCILSTFQQNITC